MVREVLRMLQLWKEKQYDRNEIQINYKSRAVVQDMTKWQDDKMTTKRAYRSEVCRGMLEVKVEIKVIEEVWSRGVQLDQRCTWCKRDWWPMKVLPLNGEWWMVNKRGVWHSKFTFSGIGLNTFNNTFNIYSSVTMNTFNNTTRRSISI